MFFRKYPLGAFSPEVFWDKAIAYVHCELGALSVLNDQRFAQHHQAKPNVAFLINWGNSAISDLFPRNELYDRLIGLRRDGYKIEIFPATFYSNWKEWDPDSLVTIDALRVTKQ